MIVDIPHQGDPSHDDVILVPLQSHVEAQNAAFRSYQAGQFSVIEVVGEIDIAVSPAMRDFLDAAISSQVVFDLRQVTFMDASGLGVLAEAWRMTNLSGGSVALVGPLKRVRRVLEVTQLDAVLPIYDTLMEAIR